MWFLMKIMSDEKGFITVFLLAMIFIIVTIMGAGIVFINNGNKRAWSTARSNQALYLAEAGLEKAIQDLKNPSANWASPTSVPETDFPSINPIGKYKVEFGPLEQSEPGIDKRILHSTGIVQSGNRKITETISIEVTKIQPSPTPPRRIRTG